jgi:hypothetical protein
LPSSSHAVRPAAWTRRRKFGNDGDSSVVVNPDHHGAHAVFAANGPTGRILTAQALDAGHVVTAVTRRPHEFPPSGPGLSVVGADVYNFEDVSSVVEGKDAVLVTLGVPYSRQPITVYSVGTGNIIGAMGNHGVRRPVCVSFSATDISAGPHGGFLLDKVLQPLVTKLLGKTLYEDMRRMESAVADSGLAVATFSQKLSLIQLLSARPAARWPRRRRIGFRRATGHELQWESRNPPSRDDVKEGFGFCRHR